MPKIMSNKESVKRITGIDYNPIENVRHESESFVDDNTNMIAADEREDLRRYAQMYYDLLKKHYKDNKLKLNENKTSFVVMRALNPNNKDTRMELKINENEVVKDDNAIKILGWWLNKKMSMRTHLQKLKGIISLKLAKIRPFLNFMSLKTRKELLYAKIGSIIMYGLPLYCGQTEDIRNDISVLFMKINKAIYNQNCYKISNARICKRIDVDLPDQLLKKTTIMLIHRMVTTWKPRGIIKLIRKDKVTRKCKRMNLKKSFRKKKCRRSVLCRGLKLYNSLPGNIKSLSSRLMKKRLKKVRVEEIPDD